MSEELKDGGGPEVTPLSEIVDKPKLTDVSPAMEKPKAEAPAPERKPKAEPKPEIPPGYVPLRETLEERDRRKEAERERDRYRQAWEEQQRRLQAEQDNDPAPNMFRDPNGYNQWLDRQLNKRAEAIARQHVEPLQHRLTDYALTLSEERVKAKIGDKWGPFNEWLAQQPQQFKDWALSQDDPYGVAFAQYRTRTVLERVGDKDIDALIEEEVAKRLAAARGPVDEPEDDIDEPSQPQRINAPRSFAASRSAPPDRDNAGRFVGPRPLGELVREKDQRRKR